LTDVLALARPELRALRPYVPGAYEPGFVRLNANESPWRAPGDTSERGLNRYPPPRPSALRARLAEHYGTRPESVLVTRGSSEAIDVLIRGFCAAGRDSVVICPPTFDMYRLYAEIQGAEVISVPLLKAETFALDTARLIDSIDERAKLVFVCSPNNPTGQSANRKDVVEICEAAAGRALVVIDEAYCEFSERDDFSDLRQRYQHLVLLRTLSKCAALAGVRCGTLLGAPRLVEFLEKVLPPYTFPTPSIELALKALSPESLHVSEERVGLLRLERQRLAAALDDAPDVRRVWPSDANFVLIEAVDGQRFQNTAHKAGILVRTFADQPSLRDCVRISVGRPEDNDRLLQAIAGVETDGV
jgi:histidinol-phosphate aminotransferase